MHVWNTCDTNLSTKMINTCLLYILGWMKRAHGYVHLDDVTAGGAFPWVASVLQFETERKKTTAPLEYGLVQQYADEKLGCSTRHSTACNTSLFVDQLPTSGCGYGRPAVVMAEP